MGAYTTRLAWETLRHVDSATLGASYVALGGPLLHPSFINRLVNNSSVLVTISIDGVNDVDVVPNLSSWNYKEASGQEGYQTSLPAGTQIFIKSGTGAAGTGLVYFVSQYIVTA